MSQWAYGLPNKELVEEFARACAQSGMSNSGLVIDVMGSVYYAEEVRYLKGVLLARLEGAKPPFGRGDIVKTKTGKNVYSVEHAYSLPHNQRQIISRIYYDGGRWLLKFKGVPAGERGYPRFNADEFVLKSSAAIIVASRG